MTCLTHVCFHSQIKQFSHLCGSNSLLSQLLAFKKNLYVCASYQGPGHKFSQHTCTHPTHEVFICALKLLPHLLILWFSSKLPCFYLDLYKCWPSGSWERRGDCQRVCALWCSALGATAASSPPRASAAPKRTSLQQDKAPLLLSFMGYSQQHIGQRSLLRSSSQSAGKILALGMISARSLSAVSKTNENSGYGITLCLHQFKPAKEYNV